MDEFSLIERYFTPMAGEGAFGLRDDAARLEPEPGMSLVVTQDAIAEGIHFFSTDPPEMIAKKALRVNLSDLAAKGARPRWFSLALGLSDNLDEAWIAAFARGLADDCRKFEILLTGGDTFRSGGGLVISITAIGDVLHREYVSRLGANHGDNFYVTGTLGDAAAGLLIREGILADIKDPHRSFLEDRYLLPRPRNDFAKILREFATASIDVSDGLLGDLEKLCRASDVSANIKFDALPLSAAMQALLEDKPELLECVVSGGDDYEILFAVAPDKVPEFESKIGNQSLRVTPIAKASRSDKGVNILDNQGNAMKFQKSGYIHFGETR